MTTDDRTWDYLTHRERADIHRTNAEVFDGLTIARDPRYASIDPALEAARERRAAETEDALAAEEDVAEV